MLALYLKHIYSSPHLNSCFGSSKFSRNTSYISFFKCSSLFGKSLPIHSWNVSFCRVYDFPSSVKHSLVNNKTYLFLLISLLPSYSVVVSLSRVFFLFHIDLLILNKSFSLFPFTCEHSVTIDANIITAVCFHNK